MNAYAVTGVCTIRIDRRIGNVRFGYLADPLTEFSLTAALGCKAAIKSARNRNSECSTRLRQHNHRLLPRQIPDGRLFYAKPWGVGKSVVKSLRIYAKSTPLWMGTNYATQELR